MIRRRVDLAAAMAIVIANMIGAGLFTSLGYQLIETPAGFPVLLIWLRGIRLVSLILESSTLRVHHRRDGRLIRVHWPTQIHVLVTGFRLSLPE